MRVSIQGVRQACQGLSGSPDWISSLPAHLPSLQNGVLQHACAGVSFHSVLHAHRILYSSICKIYTHLNYKSHDIILCKYKIQVFLCILQNINIKYIIYVYHLNYISIRQIDKVLSFLYFLSLCSVYLRIGIQPWRGCPRDAYLTRVFNPKEITQTFQMKSQLCNYVFSYLCICIQGQQPL